VVTIGGTYSAPTFVIGDPTASLFTGVTPGSVNHSNINSAGTTQLLGGPILSGTSKSYLKFSNIYWTVFTGAIVTITGRYNEFEKCVFESMSYAGGINLTLTALSGQALDAVISKCIFYKGNIGVNLVGNTNVADTTSISSSLFSASVDASVNITTVQTKIYNCSMFPRTFYSIVITAGSASFPTTVYNCIIPGTLFVGAANIMVEDFNRFVSSRQGTIAVGTNTTNNGAFGLDIGQSLLFGLNNLQRETSYLGSPNTSFGTATGAPATDLYGVTWSGSSPDAGSGTYRPVGGVGAYYPTERNASTITIAPGATSQSIELYLGAIGLTASTSGLSARYNRTRTASVDIPLVARTIAQAWTAGGFAEVDSTNMPGVYRLDIPNEALVGGADDVTVTVRGASGTNGAVVSIDMRNYSFISTTGYKLISDQLGANGALDVIKGSSITVKLQITDVNQKPVPIGSATCTVQVYSLNNLVATYPVVVQYQSNGEMTFVLDTAVTTAPGSYNIYVNRNNGGSDTVVYGPMKLTVSNL
jgi:hypothetical protein